MASRFWLPSSGDAAISPAFGAVWNATGSGIPRLRLAHVKTNTPMATLTRSMSGVSGNSVLVAQYVSDPLAAQTIAAGTTISGVARMMQNAASNNLYPRIAVYVRSNTGTTLRGTLWSSYAEADYTELDPTAQLSRFLTRTSADVLEGLPLVIQSGDRLVVEFGVKQLSTNAANQTSLLRVGDAAASDLPLSEGSSLDNAPWIEISQTLNFDVPREGNVSWAELQTPDVPVSPREGHVSWANLETPDASIFTEDFSERFESQSVRRAHVSHAELELPDLQTGLISWAELEVPSPTTFREGHVSWAELEAPLAPREGIVSWAELQTPDVPREGHVSWAELETPDRTREGHVSWSELQVPDVNPINRQGWSSWAELEVPGGGRAGHLSWSHLEVPTYHDFGEALKKSHVAIFKVEVLDDGVPVRELKVLSGNVSVDSSAAIRRRCDISLTDYDGTLVPAVAEDLLAPFGNELRLYRGIRFHDIAQPAIQAGGGDAPGPGEEGALASVVQPVERYYSLGVFGIAEVSVSDSGEQLEIQIDGYDRARRVQRARFTDVYVVADGTNARDAIEQMLSPVLPGVPFNLMTTTRVLNGLVFEAGGDRWEAAQQIAESIGAELYFDVNGVLVLRPVPDPLEVPITWVYEEGEEATVLYIERSLTDEQTYNHVIVTGESTDNTAPVRAEALDDDPESPTYYLGDYGDVVYFFRSEFIATEEQAQDTANGLLLKVLGTTELVRFNAIVNPSHEAGDVVEIRRGASKIDARYVLDAFNIPLGSTGTMNVTTRRRKL